MTDLAYQPEVAQDAEFGLRARYRLRSFRGVEINKQFNGGHERVEFPSLLGVLSAVFIQVKGLSRL
jgi:hypothetical protein